MKTPKPPKFERISLGGGEVTVPAGWRRISDHDLVREAAPQRAALALNRTIAPPRLQVSLLASVPAAPASAEAMVLALYEAMRASTAGVALKERGAFRFDDGIEGASLRLEVEPVPGFRATQIHVARIDAGGPARILASVPATEGAKAIEEVRAILQSYAPTR